MVPPETVVFHDQWPYSFRDEQNTDAKSVKSVTELLAWLLVLKYSWILIREKNKYV